MMRRTLVLIAWMLTACAMEVGDEGLAELGSEDLESSRAYAWGTNGWDMQAGKLDILDRQAIRYYRFGLPFNPVVSAASQVSRFDLAVAAAASRRLALLPIVSGPADTFDSSRHSATVISTRYHEWREFNRLLAARYGSNGAFWRAHPELPQLRIRAWEVWNEPNLAQFWTPRFSVYRNVLRVAREGLRRGDPNARVIMAGLAPGDGVDRVREIVSGPDGHCLFDAVGYHPYGRDPAASMDKLRQVRGVLVNHGIGNAPIWITEVGWAVPGDGWSGTTLTVSGPSQQASYLADLASRIRNRRGDWNLGPMFWYSFHDVPGSEHWSGHCGLTDVWMRARPSLYSLGNIARNHVSVPLPPLRCMP